jgi:glycosyltransferase involved in cell wall biosynthesis
MTKDLPVVSVIMSVHNDKKTVTEAIESILSQTYSRFEFLIMNDASSDGSLEIVQAYSLTDSRIRIFSHEYGVGLTKSLNELLAHSVGEYVARIDADDISHRSRLEVQVQYMETHNHVVLCGTQGWYMNEAGVEVGVKNVPVDTAVIQKKLLWNNQFIHSSWLFRRDIIVENGGYNSLFLKSQDYELILRIAQKYTVVNLADRLVWWRVRSNSISWQNRQQEWYALKARWYAVTTYGYSFWYGMYCIAIRFLWMCVPVYIKRKRYAR